MTSGFERRLNQLQTAEARAALRQIRHGIEKESLRVDRQGKLAQTPHPQAFGPAMTHPAITTDFSEALLELITPVDPSIEASLATLDRIHREVCAALDDEILWAASMPCPLQDDEHIPVAQYGQSNTARMKSVYRLGLGERYGRRMQTIAGIHYNFSLPDQLWPLLGIKDGDSIKADRTEAYFSLIRNFRRFSWLLIYLLGAAPAVCGSFIRGREHQLSEIAPHSYGQTFATSLRMGDLGYQSNAQSSLNICYNTLDNYVNTLKQAIRTPHPEYQKIGLKRDGAHIQLNDGLLQIENEFYSPIRPKRVTASGETPLGALRRDGVEYIEVRCIDVNPEHPLGIDASSCYFLDAFLLYCLLEDSPLCDERDNRSQRENLLSVVNQGRDPALALSENGEQRGLKDWATQLLAGIADCADLLDQANDCDRYSNALKRQQEHLQHPDMLPSAKLVAEMQQRQISWFELALEHSEAHFDHFKSRPLNDSEQQAAAALRAKALEKWQSVEAQSGVSFDEHLRDYYRQYDAL